MTGRAAGRLHGDDLVGEVLRNMEEGLFRIRGKTVVPSIYRIYLNASDFEPFRDVVPFISGEIRAALDERLDSWNGTRRRFAAGLLKKIGAAGNPAEVGYIKLADSWTVEIYPDLDGTLAAGEIEVYSDLGAPEHPEYGVGSLTRRIFPQQQVPAAERPDSSATVATPRPAGASVVKEDTKAGKREDDRTKDLAFAYLRFADEKGDHVFEVTSSHIVIGRGGRSYWVDVKVDTLPDVSREHCRIRRESETGRFLIEDVSQFGTAIDGIPVGKNSVAELPRYATITLAGVLDLHWEAA